MTRKIFWLFAFFMMLSVNAKSQTNEEVPRSNIRYVKEHKLFQQRGEVNVLDFDLEWPELLDNQNTEPLRKALSELLFKSGSTDLDTAMTTFKQKFGTEVVSQFKELPADSMFCYVTCALKTIGYSEGRFVSYSLDYICTPASGSPHKSDTISKYITYDLTNATILYGDDIVSQVSIKNEGYSAQFINELMQSASVALPDEIYGIALVDAALTRNGVAYNGFYITGNETVPITWYVSEANSKDIMKRAAKKLLTGKGKANPTATMKMLDTWNGESVFSKGDTNAQFPGGRAAMKQYIADNITLPVSKMNQSDARMVYVSFIVTKDGNIADTRIIGQSWPELDREAINMIRLMPRWHAGQIGNQAVNTRITIPISFQMK